MSTTITEAPAETERRIYRLTRDELDATATKIAKLNDRAAKKNLPGRLGLTTEKVEVIETLPSGFEVTRIFWDTEIIGDAPRYGGWKFIATLDWDPAAGLITRTVPGFEGKIDRTGLREHWCDHCNADRVRNLTYLLENAETGETRQVGSSCIKDFLGQAITPSFFSDVADVEADCDGFLAGGFARDYDFSPETVLAVAWAVIQEFGFVRSGDYYDIPTKARVADILYPPLKGQAREDALKLARRLQPHVDRAAGQAKLIKAYILSDDFSGTSEYVTNLKAICAAERVSRRFFGLLASAPQAWARSVERDLRRAAEKATLVNDFFGEVGQRLVLKVSVKSIRFIEGDWGTTTLYTLVTSDGHLVKYFASRGILGGEVTTKVFVIKATIKKFDEYEGHKATVITRAKVLEVSAS